MGSYLKASDDNNATFQAIDEYFGENDIYQHTKKYRFLHFVNGVLLNLKT
ncbi:hypothetical protein SD457_26555 [Coprobacillaceae bacterium CR2/5/TPMF4]|nr:hypothetical protein SD457_26555 [Coprobacillaceae bacterium CR2/5/TPMF4]